MYCRWLPFVATRYHPSAFNFDRTSGERGQGQFLFASSQEKQAEPSVSIVDYASLRKEALKQREVAQHVGQFFVSLGHLSKNFDQPRQTRAILALCERHANAEHKKTRELARELLNDWDTFWVVLDYPWLPLTNNEAERALRHWVIARRISYGTRTEQGSRAFALTISVIETCRKRGVSPWPYLTDVIRQRRKGLPAPALPQLAV